MDYKHRHFSSKKERVTKLCENPGDIFYNCTLCGKTHLTRDGERIPLIITSILLFEWFRYKPDRNEEVHIDYIQIADLFLALRTEYSEANRPLDVLVIAGQEDILTTGTDEVMSALMDLKRWVIQHNVENTCEFVTLPVSPNPTNNDMLVTMYRQVIWDLNSRLMYTYK